MTKTEASELVAMLAAAFPHAALTERTLDVYERMLADLEVEPARIGVARLLATLRFFPSIAEIRAAAVEVQHGPRRTGIEAWGDVESEMRRVGGYGRPRFDDPLVAEYVARSGWEALCQTSGNESSDRAQFARWYDAQSERTERDLRAGHALPPAQGYGALAAPGTTRGPRPAGDAVAGLLGGAGGGSR